MSTTYILQSLKDNNYYTGSTRNLDDRLIRHFAGRSKATKNRCPWKLIFTKEFATYQEACKFEKFIKRQKSKKFIEGLLKITKTPPGAGSSVGRASAF